MPRPAGVSGPRPVVTPVLWPLQIRIDFIGHTVRRLNVQTARLDGARPLHGGRSPATALLTAGAAALSPDVTAVTDGDFIGLAARCLNVQPARRDGTCPLNNVVV